MPALTTLIALALAFSVAELPTPAHAAQAQQNNDEPDVLLMALLTVGVAGAAAVVALIGYFIRNQVGFWLHRPPPREDGTPDEHH
jgi:hypothetical protein